MPTTLVAQNNQKTSYENVMKSSYGMSFSCFESEQQLKSKHKNLLFRLWFLVTRWCNETNISCSNCGEAGFSCPADEFKCECDCKCYPMSIVCDGVKQCSDGADENADCPAG